MKSYDETVNSVFSKIDEYNTEKKRKKQFALKTVAPLSCLCLAVVVAICAAGREPSKAPVDTQSLSQSSEELDGDYWVSSKDSTSSDEKNPAKIENNSSEQSQQTHYSDENDPARIMFILNRIDGEIGAAKLYFSPDKYYSEVKDKNALKEYFGKDFTSLNDIIPNGFGYSGWDTKTFYYEHTGNIAYDTSQFMYTKNQAEISILVSKIGAPHDCAYSYKNDTEPSEINGISVIMGYKAIPINDEEQWEFVFADFSCDGLSYRIGVRGFENTKDMGIELYKLVAALTE